MDQEEAALRAKIQAVRNLLAAKQQAGANYAMGHRHRATTAPYRAPYASYHVDKSVASAHKTWTRPNASPPQTATVTSANKVWVNADAVRKTPPSAPVRVAKTTSSLPSTSSSTTKPTRTSFVTHARGRMQLQMLRLEDGEYAKANGGFSLVRSDVMKAKAAEKTKAQAVAQTVSVVRRPSVASASAANRAQAAVTRARAAARGKTKHSRVRTEYCRFFNKFGYCNNKNACKFLHDSRRVALCRKFARGSCDDAACQLSHDKNKMPVCTLFLRGACTRDDCRFRHVKVSGSARLCEAFLKGYCPQGEACLLKHELPKTVSTKRPLAASTNASSSEASMKLQKIEAAAAAPAVAASGTSPPSGTLLVDQRSAPASASSSLSSVTTKPALSIRPNILFAPRHGGGALPSLLSLRKKQPLK